LTDIVSRIDYPNLEEDMRRVFSGTEPVERSVSVAGGAGHYLARILPYRAANSEIDGVLLTFVDVTNLVAAEDQQRVLTAELSHRVKNTLTVVSSMAERTLPDGTAKTDLIARFHALGKTHELLSSAGWTEAGLREIVLSELTPHGAGGNNVRVAGPPVMLRPQAALFLALAIHELATNAAKYGALSNVDGKIEVVWTIAGESPSRIELTWTERGGPKIDGLPTRGFGMELIERGIRFELQGEAKFDAIDGGLQCKLVVPANPQHITLGLPREGSGNGGGMGS
jgi:two-component system CheB/CheR fusion protein